MNINQETILATILLVSGLFFIYPIYLYWKIYKIIKEHKYHYQWILLVLFLFFFMFGYLISAHLIFSNEPSVHPYFIKGLIFVMGMVFVVLTTRIFYYVIKVLINKREALIKSEQKLKSYNVGLEKLVKEKTKKMEQSHKRTQEKTKQLEEMREHMVFIAAHELRSPVTATSWNLQELKRLAEKKDYNRKRFKEIINDITESNLHLSELVNDLLDISRLEQGTFKIKKTEVDLQKLIADLIEELGALADEQGIKVRFKKPASACKIKSDEKRIREILTNLFSNAVKYNLPDGHVDITLADHNKTVQISLADSGIGIAKKDVKKLFNKFSRLDNDATRDIKGTGLGLYISRHLAKKLGGDISVSSPGSNQGTTFILSLKK